MGSLLGRERVFIAAEPDLPVFTFTSRDGSGSSQIFCPVDASYVDAHSCPLSCVNEYPTQFLIAALKAMPLAGKASLRINSIGVLSLQMMIALKNDTAFLEYFIAPFSVDI